MITFAPICCSPFCCPDPPGPVGWWYLSHIRFDSYSNGADPMVVLLLFFLAGEDSAFLAPTQPYQIEYSKSSWYCIERTTLSRQTTNNREPLHHAQIQARQGGAHVQDHQEGQRTHPQALRQRPRMHPQIPLHLRLQRPQHAQYISQGCPDAIIR